MKQRSKKLKTKGIAPKKIIQFLFLGVTILVLVIAWVAMRQKAYQQIKGSAPRVTLHFSPSPATLSSKLSIQPILEANSIPIGFVRVTITFDPSAIKLSKEPIIDPRFQPLQPPSTILEANKTGEIVFMLGAKAGDSTLKPSGTLSLGTLTFTPVTSFLQKTTQINFDSKDRQIVDFTPQNLTVIASPTVISLTTNQELISANQKQLPSTIAPTLRTEKSPSPTSPIKKTIDQQPQITREEPESSSAPHVMENPSTFPYDPNAASLPPWMSFLPTPFRTILESIVKRLYNSISTTNPTLASPTPMVPFNN